MPRQAPNECLTSAQLSAKYLIPARTIRDICQRATLEPKNSEGYDELEVAAAIIRYQRERLDSFDVEASKDRARKTKSEANNAELDEAQKRGELMMKKDGELLWADLTIKQRTLISSKQDWKSDSLLKELAKIKIDK